MKLKEQQQSLLEHGSLYSCKALSALFAEFVHFPFPILCLCSSSLEISELSLLEEMQRSYFHRCSCSPTWACPGSFAQVCALCTGSVVPQHRTKPCVHLLSDSWWADVDECQFALAGPLWTGQSNSNKVCNSEPGCLLGSALGRGFYRSKANARQLNPFRAYQDWVLMKAVCLGFWAHLEACQPVAVCLLPKNCYCLCNPRRSLTNLGHFRMSWHFLVFLTLEP